MFSGTPGGGGGGGILFPSRENFPSKLLASDHAMASRGVLSQKEPLDNNLHKSSSRSDDLSSDAGDHDRFNKALKRWRHRIWRNVLRIEEIEQPVEELEINFVRYRPETLQQLCRLTKFSKKELQLMYRGFKEEFVLGLSVLSRGTEEEKLRWVFNLYDVDNDGYLTRDNIETILSSIYDMMGPNTDPPLKDDTIKNHVDTIFSKMDDNKDGLITLEEFLHSCKKDADIRQSLHLFDTVLKTTSASSISSAIHRSKLSTG